MLSKWTKGQVTEVLEKANVSLDKCYQVNGNKFYCAFCKHQDFKFVNQHSVTDHLRVCSQFHLSAQAKEIPSKVSHLQVSRKLISEDAQIKYNEEVLNFEKTKIFIDVYNKTAIISNKQIYDPLYGCQYWLKQLTIQTPVSQTDKRQLSLSPENSNNPNFKRSNSQVNEQIALVENIIAIQAKVNQAKV